LDDPDAAIDEDDAHAWGRCYGRPDYVDRTGRVVWRPRASTS
jgi:hypothetical protein